MPSPYKHSKTGVYWLRDRTPADVARAARGQTVFIDVAGTNSPHRIGAELKVSLGTKEPAVAKLRGAQVTVQFDAIWEGFRHPPRRLTQKEIAALSGEVYAALVTAHEDNPGQPEGWLALSAAAQAPVGTGLRIGEALPLQVGPHLLPAIVARVLALNGLSNVDGESAGRLVNAAMTQWGKGAERLSANAGGDWMRINGKQRSAGPHNS